MEYGFAALSDFMTLKHHTIQSSGYKQAHAATLHFNLKPWQSVPQLSWVTAMLYHHQHQWEPTFQSLRPHSGHSQSTCMNSVQTPIECRPQSHSQPYHSSSPTDTMSKPLQRFKDLAFSINYSNAKCASAQSGSTGHGGGRVGFSGSCSRCILGPLHCSTLLK
jgi:hypothetical protein